LSDAAEFSTEEDFSPSFSVPFSSQFPSGLALPSGMSSVDFEASFSF